MRVMDCIGERQLSVQDSIRADLGKAEVTLTLKAEESSGEGEVGVCAESTSEPQFSLFTDPFFSSERTGEGKTNRKR